MATVSNRPWGDFSAAYYSPEQWRRACLVDTGEGDEDSKDRYKLPVREPDGTLNRNGVHAAAGGHGVSAVKGISPEARKAAARKLAALYRNELDEDPPDSLTQMAGSAGMGGRSTVFTRAFPLDDIVIRSDGDGRTVEAYAAVFDVETEIRDQQGHYRETINRAAFNKTVKDRGTRFGVFYNHGMTLHGTPSERGSMPLGSLVEPPRSDGRGLVTVTRYNRTQQADEVLEAIRNGDITGQSFTGRAVRSDPEIRRGGRYMPDSNGVLPVVTRHEIAMREFGPTPIPAYDRPMVLTVRSLVEQVEGMDDDEREAFRRMLGLAADITPDGEPSGDSDSGTENDEDRTATPEVGAGADEPREHSIRSMTPQTRAALWRITHLEGVR